MWKKKKGRGDTSLLFMRLLYGNVRSLANKMGKLVVLTNSQREFREYRLSFTETWLHSHIPDHSVTAPGFLTVWADRDTADSSYKKGGGMHSM